MASRLTKTVTPHLQEAAPEALRAILRSFLEAVKHALWEWAVERASSIHPLAIATAIMSAVGLKFVLRSFHSNAEDTPDTDAT